MTFATEAAKYGNEPVLVVEFTDGVSTYRFAAADVAIKGVGYVEGRISSFGSCSRQISQVCDNSGPDIALIDDDGTVEGYAIGSGWTCTVKVGFVALAWASWLTFATYRVLGRPSRMGRVLYLRCVAPGLFTFGRLTMPKIEAGDTYLFTTLRVATDRVGEPLPFRFGSHGIEGGAVDLVYLGISPSTEKLVWLVAAADVSDAPYATGNVGDVFVDGVRLENLTYTVTVDATGNYQYLLLNLSVDQAARLGILDDKTYRTYRIARRADLERRRGGPTDRRSGVPQPVASGTLVGARPVRQLTCNLVGPYGNAVDLIEYLLTEHGLAVASRSFAHYVSASSYLEKMAIAISGEILGDVNLRSLVDQICSETGLEQFYTSAGLHALLWPYNLGADDAADGLAGSYGYSDLHDVIGEPRWQYLDGGDKAPMTEVELTTPYGTELIADADGVSEYGTRRISVKREIASGLVLSRALEWLRIQTHKEPRTVMRAAMPLHVVDKNPGLFLRMSAHGGPALAGWDNEVCRVSRVTLGDIGLSASLDLEDRGPIEDTMSAYMLDADSWLAYTITVNWNATGRHGTTADADAASLRVGDIAWWENAAGTDGYLFARVQKVVESGGTYYIYVADTLPNPAGSKSTKFLRPDTVTTPSAGRSDGKRCSTLLHEYLTTDPACAFGLFEKSGVPGDTAQTSGTSLFQLRSNGSKTFSWDGQFGPVWVLDGSTGYYDDATALADLQILGALSIVCWFEITGTMDAYNFIGCAGQGAAADDNFLYQLYCNADGSLALFWEYDTGTNVYVTTTATGLVDAGHKYFIVVTRAADGVCKFYVGDNDTAPALVYTSGTNTMPSDGANAALCIGASARGYASKLPGWCQGVIVDVAAYSQATIDDLWSFSKREPCSVVV